jgi:Ca-activated chloride channel family protein
VLLLAAMLCGTLRLQAQKEKIRILLVFDCSYSMTAKWDKTTRMEAAKKILTGLVDSMKDIPNLELALRCYGHQSYKDKHDCQDTKLEVPFKPGNSKEIIDFVKKLQPNGYTPIAYSLTQAAKDFPADKGKNVVLLITDGIEECDGDPCAVSKQLQARNIFLKPYIVGIGLTDEKMKFFDCVGKNYNPSNEKDLKRVVTNVVLNVLNNTKVVVQLMDTKGQPTETDADMTFYNAKNGKIEYNFYHTMAAENLPDTFSLDPANIYNLQVNSVPAVFKNNISLQAGKVNVLKLDMPRGSLKVSCQSSKDYEGIQCLVRKAGSQEILNVQNLNSTQDYIVGNYDLEILTLPRTNIKGVKIGQDNVSQSVIPDPGKLEINYAKNIIGGIYIQRGAKLEWVTDINGSSAERKELYVLQPGSYTIVYRPETSTRTLDTKEKHVDIPAGGFLSATLY